MQSVDLKLVLLKKIGRNVFDFLIRSVRIVVLMALYTKSM